MIKMSGFGALVIVGTLLGIAVALKAWTAIAVCAAVWFAGYWFGGRDE